jgi:hypothetical protein
MLSARGRKDDLIAGRVILQGLPPKLLMSYVLFKISRVIIQDSGRRRN